MGRRVKLLEHLLCFKRTNQGDGVEHPFGTAIGNNVASSAMLWLGSIGAKSLIWSDPVNVCESVGLLLSFQFRLLFFEDRASNSLGRFERRLISLIFAGRNRIILIRRELPLTVIASPAEPVA
jgi:hypothetical protein